MSLDHSLYSERPVIKELIRGLDLTQGECARRLGYKPPTFRGKLNGEAPMDAQEEKKILADLAAMMEGT